MLKPNSQVTTNLINARELIADEKNWCQGSATDADGRHCAVGALWEVFGNNNVDAPEFVMLGRACGSLFILRGIAQVNDNEGHAAIMAVFDRAIELSLQEQGESQ